MTSNFAALAAMSRRTVDAVHGEAAILKPTDRGKGPHGARTASVTRAETEITVAFFQDTELQARRRAQPLIGQTGDRMMNRSPEIFGSVAPDVEIATGDKIVRDPTGAPKYFEVISRDPDGIGNFILGLVEIKG